MKYASYVLHSKSTVVSLWSLIFFLLASVATFPDKCVPGNGEYLLCCQVQRSFHVKSSFLIFSKCDKMFIFSASSTSNARLLGQNSLQMFSFCEWPGRQHSLSEYLQRQQKSKSRLKLSHPLLPLDQCIIKAFRADKKVFIGPPSPPVVKQWDFWSPQNSEVV